MTFRVGQKVVCVNDGLVFLLGTPDLKRGQIYTVRKVYMNTGDLMLRLENVSSGWVATRFRPIVERNTDITVFTEILRKTNIGVDA